MSRHLLHRPTGELRPYPRQDVQPVAGLDRAIYHVLQDVNEPQPLYDLATQMIVAADPVITITDPDSEDVNGTVTYSWRVEPLPPPPLLPDVLGFFSELSRNPAIAVPIGDLLAEMMQPRPNPHHAPQAALGLGVGLGQVADKGDPRVFLDAWHQALERGLLGPELIAGVQQLAQVHNLPAEFIAALQPSGTP